MEAFLRKTVNKSFKQIPTQYLEFISPRNTKFFPANYFSLPEESIKKGLDFIRCNFPLSTSDLVTALTFRTNNTNNSTTVKDSNNIGIGSSSSFKSLYHYESLYVILYSLDLLSGIAEALYLKTFVSSLKSVIYFYITNLNPILINFEQNVQQQLKASSSSCAAAAVEFEYQVNTFVCLAWVLVKEGLISEELGRKIVGIVLIQSKNIAEEEKEDEDEDELYASEKHPSTSSTTTYKSWQKFDLVTNANILRLAYTVGIGIKSAVTSEEEEEFEYEEQLETIETHLLCILQNKSYLQIKTSSSTSSSSVDTFLYIMTQLTTAYRRPFVLFEDLLLEAVQERLGNEEDNESNRNNSIRAFSMRILTFESLNLLKYAKVRNKLCNELNLLKKWQNSDGSWCWPGSVDKTAAASNLTSVEEEEDDDDTQNYQLTNTQLKVDPTKITNWTNEKLITTVFALKSIHVFYDRRRKAVQVEDYQESKIQHIII